MRKNKVILISVDGMRPDGFLQCGNPYVETMLREAVWSVDARTAFPSVTLPCHMSMFHSVPPERHGVTTNTYVPQVRPVEGLAARLKSAKKVCAMFYGWEPLRDITRPGNLRYAEYTAARIVDLADDLMTDRALACIASAKPDFVFLYLVDTDEKGGHDNGWMSEEYLRRVSLAIDDVKRVREACGEEYDIIVTADHGGHDRSHGTDLPEDMTIPVFLFGDVFGAPRQFHGGSILDIAPTVVDLFGLEPAEDWEGTSLISPTGEAR